MNSNIFVNKKVLKKFVQLNKTEAKRMLGEDRPIFSVARVDNLDNGCYLIFTNSHYMMGFKIAELSDNIAPMLVDFKKLEALLLTTDGKAIDLSKVLECTSDIDGNYPDASSILEIVNREFAEGKQSHAFNWVYIKMAVEFIGTYTAEYVSKYAPVHEITTLKGQRKYYDSNRYSFAIVLPVRA